MAPKRYHIWTVVLAAWIFQCICGLGPSLGLAAQMNLEIWEKLSFLAFTLWLAFAWLCSAYYFSFTLLGPYFAEHVKPGQSSKASYYPPVAILYVTCHDFCSKAFRSCMMQDYPDYHVFLLDDSGDSELNLDIDAAVEPFSARVTIIRRHRRTGFKAGNLNHCLRQLGNRYPFFAVCDADSVLPVNFLCATVQAIQTNPRIGFVQAIHKLWPLENGNRFVRELGPSVETYWQVFRSADRFGFAMLHGHGALIRTAVWREVGGFPEIVAEDLAFSTRMAEYGYWGLFDDICCEEVYPESYWAFCRRQIRYVKGTAEHARLFLWSFLRSKNVTWIEKLDRTLATAIMVSPAGLLMFFATSLGMNRPIRSLVAGNLAMSIFSALAFIAPVAPAIFHRSTTRRNLFRHLVTSIAVYLSVIPTSALAAMQGFFAPVKVFNVTGEKRPKGKPGFKTRLLAGLTTVTVLILSMVILGKGLIGPVPVLFALAFGSFAKTFEWDDPSTRVVSALPMIGICIVIYILFFK